MIPKISVIMAVYNVEKYIRKSIDSVLNQSFGDFELICVDDGSTDSSGKICDEYAEKDSRVRVFHKENGGVASARQFGYDVMKGEYSIHCDPDDWVENDWLEKLYGCAKEENADIVFSNYYIENKNQQNLFIQKPSKNGIDCVNSILSHELHGSLCTKLILNRIIRTYKIRFIPGINYCEDELINFQVLLNSTKIGYVSKAFYHYCHRIENDSICDLVSETSEKYLHSLINIYEIQSEMLKNIPDCEKGLINRKLYIKDLQLFCSSYSFDEYKKLPYTFSELFFSKLKLRIKVGLLLAKLSLYKTAKAYVRFRRFVGRKLRKILHH